MQTKQVTVLPYQAKWKSDFEEIKKEIALALGDLAVKIEHVGSTSVEGLSAKPCIDIDVVILSNADLPAAIERLEKIGYIHEGNLGIEGREAFRYTDKPHLQTHHLYVCPMDSKELHRHLVFRDFLRNHPDAARKYGDVKEKAATLFPHDIGKYMEYKSACIEELYRLCGLEEK